MFMRVQVLQVLQVLALGRESGVADELHRS
jgi:hypothetical protein